VPDQATNWSECAGDSTNEQDPVCFKSQQYRAKADEYGELAKKFGTDGTKAESLKKMQDRLASQKITTGTSGSTITTPVHGAEESDPTGVALARRGHVLSCSRAAVIMKGSLSDETADRELFDLPDRSPNIWRVRQTPRKIARYSHNTD